MKVTFRSIDKIVSFLKGIPFKNGTPVIEITPAPQPLTDLSCRTSRVHQQLTIARTDARSASRPRAVTSQATFNEGNPSLRTYRQYFVVKIVAGVMNVAAPCCALYISQEQIASRHHLHHPCEIFACSHTWCRRFDILRSHRFNACIAGQGRRAGRIEQRRR